MEKRIRELERQAALARQAESELHSKGVPEALGSSTGYSAGPGGP
jgi:hypothetical protein